MSDYATHYANLHDDALVDLALRDTLRDDARAALLAELARRGITDLDGARRVQAQELAAEAAQRRQVIARKARITRWRTGWILFMGVMSVGYGIYRLNVPNTADPGDDGGLMVLLGVGLMLFGVVSARVTRWLNERILHRPPPRP